MCGFKQKLQNCSEYTQGKVDSDNVEVRYSLRPMTSLLRHIFLAEIGASLQHAISHEPRISFFCEHRVTCWCVDAVVSCIMWWI